MHHITTAERRTRLVRRHHLADPPDSVEALADGLVGLHSSDPATVHLAAQARMPEFTVGDMEDALYERRTLLRILGMRRTMFVATRDLAATMDAACTQALAATERRRLVKMIAEQGIAKHADRWVDRVEAATLEALEARGEATANELGDDVPRLRRRIHFGRGRSWEGSVAVSTRLLFLLATEGRIVRGRPLGSWVSAQYRWVPMATWIEGGLPELDPAEARADLARRWLASYGPGTLDDLRWWTGWTVTNTRSALADVDAVEVALDAGTGFALPDDVAAAEAGGGPEPSAALLPSLDSTVMGWKERDWYLGPHRDELFDRNGNAGPTVWCDGRIVGGWCPGPEGQVAVELLEDVSTTQRRRIEAEVERLSDWLGDTTLTPRFRTPLEKRLERQLVG